MAKGRLYIDLNEMLDGDHVLLSVGDEQVDSSGQIVRLHEGLRIRYWSDDADEKYNEDNIVGDAVVVPNPYFGTQHSWGHVKWACQIETFAHESERIDWPKEDYLDLLWAMEAVPEKAGLHFADGRSFSVEISGFPHWKLCKKGWREEFAFYEDHESYPNPVSAVARMRLRNSDTLLVGEGNGHGSYGFVVCTDETNKVKWSLFFEKSNPFISVIEKNDHIVWVESNASYWLEIDVTAPQDMQVRFIKAG